MHWDIFCKVIDNHGDVGVCWRLAADLAGRGEQVRLWLDDPSALDWMAPSGCAGVQVLHWVPLHAESIVPPPGDVVVEAFGCDPEPAFVAAMACRHAQTGRAPMWINLEYLSAEPFVERNHGLPSPVLAGVGAGLTRHFFYPGFTAQTGGLLREPGLQERRAAFDRASWRQAHGIERGPTRVISLFCYEPPGLAALLDRLAEGPAPTALLVTAGRAHDAVRQAMAQARARDPAWNAAGLLRITWLPLLTQDGYDELLWASDLNLVRGEDSVVRAVWAGQPFVWQIYPQHDDAHHAKLGAFLDWLQAPPSLGGFHQGWNGLVDVLPLVDLPAWSACVSRARERLLSQDDLASQLLRFVRRKQGELP